MAHKPTAKKKAKAGQHGGPRPNSGRPRKGDPDNFTQVTCVLRNDTVEKLREGAQSKFFGTFLQVHLDRFPIPTHEEYVAIRDGMPLFKLIKRRKVPVLISGQRPRAIRRKTPAELAREKFRKEFKPV